MSGPGINAKSAFAPNFLDVVLIQNLKAKAEARVQLLLPLQKHGRRAATTMSRTFFRMSSSRAISPASIVFPRPTSSAMNRLTRGSRRAFRRGSSWYASNRIPARNGDCKRFGSVEVTQFQRSVFRYAAKRSAGSNPRFAIAVPCFSRAYLGVEFVIPKHVEGLSLGVIVYA